MIYDVCKKNYKSGKTIRRRSHQCRTHISSDQTACSYHRVSEQNLKKLVLGHIKEMAGQIALDEDRLSRLTQTAKQAQAKLSDIDRWIRLIKEKSTLNEVDRDLLECLVGKIEVGEKSGGRRKDTGYKDYIQICRNLLNAFPYQRMVFTINLKAA